MRHLFLILVVFFSAAYGMDNRSILQADIQLTPNQGSKDNEVVAPDTTIYVSAIVTNTGDDMSVEMPFFVRYAFPGPKDKLYKSEIFRTEEVMLPPIEPAKSVTITFTKTHRWPSIFEFIRKDWNLRQYQAIVEVEDKRFILGTAAIAFHMYYYPGPKHELPKELPGQE